MVRSSFFYPFVFVLARKFLRSFSCFEVVEDIGLGEVLQQSTRMSSIYQARHILRELFC